MTAPTDNLVRVWAVPQAVEMRADATGDGNTLFGHFAVFNEWTEINSMWEGQFLERIAPGAFAETFAKRGDQIRVLYDHGADPSVGNKPLGVPQVLKEDRTGAYYEVPLFDASYVNDLKPALRAGQLGASFRFKVTGEEWNVPSEPSRSNPQQLEERTITSVELYEFGPVTFPAYEAASAGLRSATDQFIDRFINDELYLKRFIERAGPAVADKIRAALPPTAEVAVDPDTPTADGEPSTDPTERNEDTSTTVTADGGEEWEKQELRRQWVAERSLVEDPPEVVVDPAWDDIEERRQWVAAHISL